MRRPPRAPPAIRAVKGGGSTVAFPRLDGEAQAVRLDFPRGMLRLGLADGRVVMVPLEFYPTLAAATPAQRKAWEYLPFGVAIEWPALDLQLSVESIVAGRREHVPPAGFAERMARAAARARSA